MTEQSANSLPPHLVDECYRQWSESLSRFAWTVTRDWSLANDAVQNAFIAFSKSGHLVQEPARKAWLYKVTFRQAVRLRDESNKQFGSLSSETIESDLQPVDLQLSPLGKMVAAEDLARVSAAIQMLPIDQQQVIQLRIYEGKSFAEVALALGVPLGTALSRMRLALEKLRACFRQES